MDKVKEFDEVKFYYPGGVFDGLLFVYHHIGCDYWYEQILYLVDARIFN